MPTCWTEENIQYVNRMPCREPKSRIWLQIASHVKCKKLGKPFGIDLLKSTIALPCSGLANPIRGFLS